jgi:hypothetical protein
MIKDEVMIVNGQDTGEGKWSQHPELLRKVIFKTAAEPHVKCIAIVDGAAWKVILNDFPDEPLYTVHINERPIMFFNDWPDEIWKIEE